MVNREVGNELRLEANFTCEGTNPIQPLVVNSDCQHDATFYVLLRATTGGYLVEMHVVGIKGEATHNSTVSQYATLHVIVFFILLFLIIFLIIIKASIYLQHVMITTNFPNVISIGDHKTHK